MINKNKLRIHRKRRIRSKVKGTSERPRLCVFKSLRGFYAQLIDDEAAKTLVSADLRELKGKGNTTEKAGKVGELIAKKALDKKIDTVVFDRSGYRYHGKIKSFADGARKGGLNF